LRDEQNAGVGSSHGSESSCCDSHYTDHASPGNADELASTDTCHRLVALSLSTAVKLPVQNTVSSGVVITPACVHR